MLIYAVVKAKSKDEAADLADSVFEGLVDESRGPFDYFVTERGDGLRVAGTARWGSANMAIFRADSEKGKRIIKEVIDEQKKEFLVNLTEVREILENHSDDELFETDYKSDLWKFRHACWRVGQYQGNQIALYDENGDGIRNWYDWNGVLEYADLKEGEKMYVVPADVHF